MRNVEARAKAHLKITLTLGLASVVAGGYVQDAQGLAQPEPPPTHKLIEFGWDRPTPDILRARAANLDSHPFDGVVVKLHAGPAVFTRQPYPASALAQDLSDLESFHSARLTDNFLLMWTTREQDWDWYSDSDWAAAEQNIRNFAHLARAGGFRGILLDTEAYGPAPWDYRQQPHRDVYSDAAYEQMLRTRGAQFMRAVLSELADAKILLTWAPASLSLYSTHTRNPEPLKSYGLLLAFLEGAQQELRGGARIIDGNEGSYYYLSASDFAAADGLRRALIAQCEHPRAGSCNSPWGLAQAVYVDWFVPPAGSYRTLGSFVPSTSDRLKLLEQNVYLALRSSDEYVWIYSQGMNWWKGELPAGVAQAVQSAKDHFRAGTAPESNIAGAVVAAQKGFSTRVMIEGRVTHGGTGVAGVTMRGMEAACMPTDSTGRYDCLMPSNWSGQLVPTHGASTFNPPSRGFQHVKTNQRAQDFSMQ